MTQVHQWVIDLTLSAFNQTDQHANSPSKRYCYTDLAIFSLAVAHCASTHYAYPYGDGQVELVWIAKFSSRVV